jgi:hypothetical protein
VRAYLLLQMSTGTWRVLLFGIYERVTRILWRNRRRNRKDDAAQSYTRAYAAAASGLLKSSLRAVLVKSKN